jgi:hypothetical protein
MKVLLHFGEPLGFVMNVAKAIPVLKLAVVENPPTLDRQRSSSLELNFIEFERIGTIQKGPNNGMPIYKMKEEDE